MTIHRPTRIVRSRVLITVATLATLPLVDGCVPSVNSNSQDSEFEISDDATVPETAFDELGAPPPSTEVRNNMIVTLADGYARPLETTCFYTSPFVIPPEWEFLNASDGDNCDFALQGPFADVAVIGGEMWRSSSGQSFDETVATVRSNLEAGTEPDIQILGLLNSGPSGVPLEITSEEQIDSAQPAVLFTHDSERRDGFVAYSAVVEVPAPSDGSTMFILMWSVLPPDQPDLMRQLIESMTTTLPAGFS